MSVHFDDETLRLSDDYRDERRWATQPSMGHGLHYTPNTTGSSVSIPYSQSNIQSSHDAQQAIRRRSSKACDNCRKAKCKCEPGQQQGDGCRNCELLGLVCTFLGPSRKRGPPKGYIDAIESRLHQLEAIVGALLLASSVDHRARTILEDLKSVDEMTRGVIERVNSGPFGPSARRGSDDGLYGTAASAAGRRQVPMGSKISVTMPDDTDVVDPLKWQDMLEDSILRGSTEASSSQSNRVPAGTASGRHSHYIDTHSRLVHTPMPQTTSERTVKREPSLPSVSSHPSWVPANPDANTASNVRRRVEHSLNGGTAEHDTWSSSASSPTSVIVAQNLGRSVQQSQYEDWSSSDESEEAAQALARGVGSLSIDDSNDVRYHGNTSGLQLLMRKGKDVPNQRTSPGGGGQSVSSGDFRPSRYSTFNPRERGGLWHFPPPGLWPPVDPTSSEKRSNSASSTPYLDHTLANGSPIPQDRAHTPGHSDLRPSPPVEDTLPYLEQVVSVTDMPSLEMQERLIFLYFAHVHPILPILHRDEFFEAWDAVRSGSFRQDPAVAHSGRTIKPGDKLSQALLLAMFAVASRYLDEDMSELPRGSMWTAGLNFITQCKHILYAGKLPSRLSTVQTMILTTYFDVGVGAMASAWHGSGLAIRSALDVGLNRPVDEWRAPDGSPFFDERGIETCRRTWYGVLQMENYVATYIGRPLAICENDYDTPLPSDTSKDEEIWHIPSTDHGPAFGSSASGPLRSSYSPTAGRVMSTFTERARLTSIHGAIIRDIYTVKPRSDKRALAATLEAKLDRYYLELPPPLRWDSSSNHCPAPHVVVLHMEYWCSVLLLHRPLIRSKVIRGSVDPNGSPAPQSTQRAYGLCEGAANRLISIANAYSENFAMNRCPVFFTYYIFTASIMHVTILMDNPSDVQAAGFLQQAISILDAMAIVWPSAGRASELLVAAKLNIEEKRQRVSPGVAPAVSYSDPAQQKLFGSKRPPEDNSEQLQYQSQLAHRRGMSNSISHEAPNKLFVSQSPMPSGSQLHHRMSAPDMHTLYDRTSSVSNSLDLEGRRVGGGQIYTDNTSNPGWDTSMAPSMPVFPSSQDFSAYVAPRPSHSSSTSFDNSTGYPAYPDDQGQQLSAPSPVYPMDASARFEQQVQQRSHDQYSFEASTSQQHPQTFWNNFANGGDPFGDPSKLSASLYNVPLLSDPHRPQSYRPHLPIQRNPQINGPVGHELTSTQHDSSSPNFTPRYDYSMGHKDQH